MICKHTQVPHKHYFSLRLYVNAHTHSSRDLSSKTKLSAKRYVHLAKQKTSRNKIYTNRFTHTHTRNVPYQWIKRSVYVCVREREIRTKERTNEIRMSFLMPQTSRSEYTLYFLFMWSQLWQLQIQLRLWYNFKFSFGFWMKNIWRWWYILEIFKCFQINE